MKKLSIEQKAKAYDEAIERYKAKQEYESQKVHEFTAYDETGVYVMYRTKMVDTWNNNYNYHSVPEVII